MTGPAHVTLEAAAQYLTPGKPSQGPASRLATGALELSVVSDLDSLEADWRAFESRADCTPFQTFDWLSTWHRCIGVQQGVVPAIVLGRRGNGDLLFILPLAVERTRLGSKLTFLGRALSDYNAPILARDFAREVAPEDFGTLWRRIRQAVARACRYDLVFLDKMPALVGAQANPLCALPTFLNASSAHQTKLFGDWEHFYANKRSSATRGNDRKKRRKLAEFGEVSFVSPELPEDIVQTLSVLVAQKSQKFRQMGVADLFARPGHTEFFSSLSVNARPLVHVSALRIGESLAAVNLGLIFRDCYYHILASYDDGPMARFGPGVAHLRELLRTAIEKGLSRFDFTIGDESYKLDWSDTTTDLFDHVSGAGLLGRSAAAVVRLQFRAKRYIKHSPLLWRLACRARTVVSKLRQ